MKSDNSLMISGGLLLGLSSIAWTVMSPSDVELEDSTALRSLEVKGLDTAEIMVATSDSTGKAASVDPVELAVTGLTGRSSDLSKDRFAEIASDEALPVARYGDPMMSVDMIDQGLEEKHIGDPAANVDSP